MAAMHNIIMIARSYFFILFILRALCYLLWVTHGIVFGGRTPAPAEFIALEANGEAENEKAG
jgi:hypothetical protein